ncbi:hypothetical protein HPJ37_10255 [Acinetobacter baumannii]|nr:hypothetical protein [Acinetobacter baumannii]
MFEMDKPMTFNEWLGTQGNMVLLHANCCRIAFEAGQQSQQAKVDELKATIKGNHGRIAELERLNRVKAQAIIDLHQEITELKASHHGEVIGHEVHFKKIKQERDELQTLYTQQGINMLKLQKRVEALIQKYKDEDRELKLIDEWEQSTIYSRIAIELEQALKGEGQ